MLAKWSVCARTENDRPCLCGEREERRDGERGGRREDRGAHRVEDAMSKAQHPLHPPVSPFPDMGMGSYPLSIASLGAGPELRG